MEIIHKHDRVIAESTRRERFAHSDNARMANLPPALCRANGCGMTQLDVLDPTQYIALSVQCTGSLVCVAAVAEQAAWVT